MKMEFTKMHGLGNDFIVLDCRNKQLRGLAGIVRRLSRRRLGIGFDQALVLRSSKTADFAMDIYNADGGRVEMCGNGIRCIARYVWSRRLSRKRRLAIETPAGIIRPEKAGGLVRVDMGEPELEARSIPTALKGTQTIVDRKLRAGGRTFKITCVSMGNPHCVIFVRDVGSFEVERFGPLIEGNRFFPKRTNVEFVEAAGPKLLRMRVWERGSGETPACGTGASAAVVAAGLKGLVKGKTRVRLVHGTLTVEWAQDKHVYMSGPAEEVFVGRAVV